MSLVEVQKTGTRDYLVEFKKTGTHNINRLPLYTSKKGTLLVDTNDGKSYTGINNGLPYHLHTFTQCGEPNCPVDHSQLVIVEKFSKTGRTSLDEASGRVVVTVD